MFSELLEIDDYAHLPTENGPRWVALESLARKRLELALSDTTSEKQSKDFKSLKLQYMHIVAAAAEQLGINGIDVPVAADPAEHLEKFIVSAQAATTKILMQSTGAPNIGFELRSEAKITIRHLVVQIQDEIPKLALSPRAEQRLLTSLNKFLGELDLRKSRFAVGSAHLVTALTVINLAVTTTASGPEALETVNKIQRIWGEEHERVESESLGLPYDPPTALLSPPPKMIAAPKKPE